jgi:Putative amidoligase enzyme
VTRTFGVEVEMIGLSLERVARAVLPAVGGTLKRQTDPDDPGTVFWIIEAADGRA